MLAPDDPLTWTLTILLGLLILFVNFVIIYLVIRLAITHGMLSYARQLEADKHMPVHRD